MKYVNPDGSEVELISNDEVITEIRNRYELPDARIIITNVQSHGEDKLVSYLVVEDDVEFGVTIRPRLAITKLHRQVQSN